MDSTAKVAEIEQAEKEKMKEKVKWEGEKEKEILVVLGFLNEELCTWLDWKSFLLVMFFFLAGKWVKNLSPWQLLLGS